MRSEVKNYLPNLVNNKMYDYGVGMEPNANHHRMPPSDVDGPISIISGNHLTDNHNYITGDGANSVSNRLYYSDSFRLQRAKVI